MAAYKFKMPELGEGLVEGEIVKWQVKAGDSIAEDDVICEVQNDKAVVEVPSPVSGTIKEIQVDEGTVSSVGDVLAILDVEGEVDEDDDQASETDGDSVTKEEDVKEDKGDQEGTDSQADHAEEKKATSGKSESSATAETDNKATTEADRRKVLATPGVRKLARDQGIDISNVEGSGKNGRITREDVENVQSGGEAAADKQADDSQRKQQAAAPKVSGQREEERVPLKGVRKVIANAMVKSVYTAPHVTIMDEVDVSKLVELRQQAKPLMEKKGIKVTYLPYIVKALVAAVREYPVLNASVDDESDEVVYKKYYDIGIAADTDNGLMVPVVREADRKNIWTIAQEIKDLATRARDGKLATEEMKGSTISITNIGSAGGMFFTPVINYPEVAILGTGRISEKPVVKDGEVSVGQMMALSLSFDHRIIDGATAQYAMNYIKQLLEDPQLLIMEV